MGSSWDLGPSLADLRHSPCLDLECGSRLVTAVILPRLKAKDEGSKTKADQPSH
jgi:hypothetical protein